MLKFILLALAAVWGVALAQFPAAQNQYIGSRNLLNNPGFENGVRTSWTFSGNTSTVSAETVAPLKDKISLKAVASAQIISFRQYITTPTALGGSPAQIKFSAKNTAPNVLVCVGHNGAALTGDSNCVTLATDNIKRDYVIPTSFGASSTGFDVLSASTTGTLVIDSVELGDRLDVSDVQQARLHGSVRTTPTASCSWQNTSGTPSPFAADADCPVATSTGSVNAPATKIPGFVLKGDPGDYEIKARGRYVTSSSGDNTQCNFAVNDGSTTYDSVSMGIFANAVLGTNSVFPELTFKYKKTSSSDVSIQLYSSVIAGASCNIDAISTPFVFDVYYYPPANKIFSTDSLGWFIDANIGGTNPDLGVANVSTYTEITNAGLDLVVNTDKKSQPAKILCSGTNPPTGTTCAAGNESVGISFVIPKSGQYEVCATFSHRIQTGVGAISALLSTFQLIETPLSAQTILQEGGDKKHTRLASIAANTSQSSTYPVRSCSVFNFSSAGEKAVRVMYEQAVAGSPAVSSLELDRDTGAGQRDIHFTVKPAINLERINGSFAQIGEAIAEIPNDNYVINGNFDFWQRGTSLGALGGSTVRFLADRFYNQGIGSSTVAVSRQAFVVGQSDVPNNPEFFQRTVVASVAGGGNGANIATRLEDVTKLAGKTVTVSFWAKADVTSPMAVEFEQNFGTGGSPSAVVNGIGVKTFTLTTSWQKFTQTIALPSVSGKTLGTNLNDFLLIRFWYDCGSTFANLCGSIGQQSGTFDIAQVKLEEGINATPFVLAGGTIAGELEACQRFYEIATSIKHWGYGVTGTLLGYTQKFATTKRATPTISTSGAVFSNASGLTVETGLVVGFTHYATITATGNAVYTFNWTADAEL